MIYHGQTVPRGPAPNVARRDHNRTLVSVRWRHFLAHGVGVASFGAVKDLITRHAVVHGEARKIVDGSQRSKPASQAFAIEEQSRVRHI